MPSCLYISTVYNTAPTPYSFLSTGVCPIEELQELEMDLHGISTATSANPSHIDCFPIDELLDFSNDSFFSCNKSAHSSFSTDQSLGLPSLPLSDHHHRYDQGGTDSFLVHSHSLDFGNQLSLPMDDVEDLEWLSQFVDESFSDIPNSSPAAVGTRVNLADNRAMSPFPAAATKSGSKRSKASQGGGESTDSRLTGVRRCTHCASEKTPQWRTGPLGPKTLCNACGVRYKSGRLVPEYRPASSPTFVLTQHSNSHRKVLELRRQKELLRQQHQNYGRY